MTSQRDATRARLIEAALELFAAQGVTETTTRQIAEVAQVNEVTLFRHFGSKHGLLLAAIEDATVLTQLRTALVEQVQQIGSLEDTLKDYAKNRLQALEQVSEFVRSVVGESGQYPVEHRQALGRGLTRVNRYVAEYLAAAIARGHLQARLAPEKLASLLNGMLLGYVAIESTSEFHELWDDRNDFLDNLVDLFLRGAVSPLRKEEKTDLPKVADLPASLTHTILHRAQKLGARDYALAYVLFGAGLTVGEIVNLERVRQIIEPQGHLLQVNDRPVRQVPVNQWIMGKRYGSYTRNPLTQWLKSRKDSLAALFLNQAGEPMTELEAIALWETWTQGMLSPEGQPPMIEQARDTWCVEMLFKGMKLEDLSVLSGLSMTELEPYARRARHKAALEQALRLDMKI